MNSETLPQSARRGPLLLALISVLATVLIVSAALFEQDSGPPKATAQLDEETQDLATSAREQALMLQPVLADEPTIKSRSEGSLAIVMCRQRSNAAPLEGVRLYQSTQPVSGPSKADGSLELQTSATGSLTLWAKGWTPVAIQGSELPTEVSFDPATASLEIRFLNSSVEHRLQRSLIQARFACPPTTGPWNAPLKQQAPDVWSTETITPGSYDIYIWMTLPNGELRPFSKRAVEVVPDSTTRLSIDLDQPKNESDFESDS